MVWNKEKAGWGKAAFLAAIMVALCTNISLGRYSGGTGEPNDPYRIGTPNDLNDIGNHVEDYNKYFVMVNDINTAGYIYTTSLVAPDMNTDSGFQGTEFTGVFDGNDHTIYCLTVSASLRDYIGLFGYVGSGGQIKNLGVEDPNICGRRSVRKELLRYDY